MCSHAFMAMLKPLPSEPRRLAAGTLTLSIMTAHVGCAFQPSFSSALPKLNPAMPCQHQAQHELQQPDLRSQKLECNRVSPLKASQSRVMQIQSSYRSLSCLWEVCMLVQCPLQADWVSKHNLHAQYGLAALSAARQSQLVITRS